MKDLEMQLTENSSKLGIVEFLVIGTFVISGIYCVYDFFQKRENLITLGDYNIIQLNTP